MRIKPSSYFLILILLTMAIVIGVSSTMRFWESQLLPIIIGSLVFCLAAVQLWREVRSKKNERPVTETGQPIKEASGRRVAAALGWVAGATLGVYLFGFLAGVALLMLSYLKLSGRRWGQTILVAGITTALMYGIFELGLGFRLYMGLIYESIISIISG